MTDEEKYKDFQKLMGQSVGLVVQICDSYCRRDPEASKELQDEVWYNLWTAYQRYRGESAWNTLVYRVTLNVAIDYRKHLLRRRRTLKGYAQELEDQTEDQAVERLYELLEMLGEEERMMMVMYLDKKKHDEIAEVLRISEKAVGKRIERTKKKMKKINERWNRNGR